MKKIVFSLISILLAISLMGCASDTPWRKATVTTFELAGAGIGATKDTTEILRNQNVISEEQLLKIKDIYNKAVVAYGKAGEALKLAGRASDIYSRDASLAEYTKFLSDFASLSKQVYDLIKGFKKTSLNEVMKAIENGDPV